MKFTLHLSYEPRDIVRKADAHHRSASNYQFRFLTLVSHLSWPGITLRSITISNFQQPGLGVTLYHTARLFGYFLRLSRSKIKLFI